MPWRDALTFVDEAEEDVLGPDVVVVEQARFFLRQDHYPSGPIGEAFEHGVNRLSCSAVGLRPHFSMSSLR